MPPDRLSHARGKLGLGGGGNITDLSSICMNFILSNYAYSLIICIEMVL